MIKRFNPDNPLAELSCAERAGFWRIPNESIREIPFIIIGSAVNVGAPLIWQNKKQKEKLPQKDMV
ncbi:MAG: hypothetical protein ABL869_12890 [Candidatus Nitrotoga sp.]